MTANIAVTYPRVYLLKDGEREGPRLSKWLGIRSENTYRYTYPNP